MNQRELKPRLVLVSRKTVVHWLRILGVALGVVVALILSGWITVTQPLWPIKVKSDTPKVDGIALEKHVRMLAETFRPRDCGHADNLDQTAAYLSEQLRNVGGRISEQTFVVDGITRRNVIARFGPEEGSRIVVGAHYDACGPFPAADDNASGVAGLLELARLLGQHPPIAPVEIVAFTLEEPPFFRTGNMGSARHAALLKANHIQVRAMLSLEMIGYFSDQENSQTYPVRVMDAVYPSKGNYISVVGDMNSIRLVRRVKTSMRQATTLPVVSCNAPRSVPGIDFSDHYQYWDAGFPAVMITDTADNRNFAYHTAGDTADRLDYGRMAQVVQGVYEAVTELSR